MRQGIVDQGGPAEYPDHGGQYSRSLTSRTEDNGGYETGEHHLVGGKNLHGRPEESATSATLSDDTRLPTHNLWQLVVSLGDSSSKNTHETKVVQVSPERTSRLGVDETVSPEPPSELSSFKVSR